MYILSLTRVSSAWLMMSIAIRPRNEHTFTYTTLLMSDTWDKSSHGLDIYYFTDTRFLVLTYDVNCHKASKCTYFYLHKFLMPESWRQTSQGFEVHILSLTQVSNAWIMTSIVIRSRNVHIFTHKTLVVSETWRKSSRGLDIYTLSPIQGFECLKYDVNRHTASKCTYFHLYNVTSVWQVTSIVRALRHVHTFTYTTRYLTDGANSQGALIRTYLHLKETLWVDSWRVTTRTHFFTYTKLCVGHMTSIVRHPRHITTW